MYVYCCMVTYKTHHSTHIHCCIVTYKTHYSTHVCILLYGHINCIAGNFRGWVQKWNSWIKVLWMLARLMACVCMWKFANFIFEDVRPTANPWKFCPAKISRYTVKLTTVHIWSVNELHHRLTCSEGATPQTHLQWRGNTTDSLAVEFDGNFFTGTSPALFRFRWWEGKDHTQS